MNLKQLMRTQIAPQLIAIRKQKGLSLQDVALQSPLSMNMIALMEQGALGSARHYLRLIKFYDKKLEIKIINLS